MDWYQRDLDVFIASVRTITEHCPNEVLFFCTFVPENKRCKRHVVPLVSNDNGVECVLALPQRRRHMNAAERHNNSAG